LVHAGVREEEGGIVVRDARGGRPEGVRVILDVKIDEGLADF
jgi:hypothetical protein